MNMKLTITLDAKPTTGVNTADVREALKEFGNVRGVTLSHSPENMALRKATQLLHVIENETDPHRIVDLAKAAEILLTLSRGGK